MVTRYSKDSSILTFSSETHLLSALRSRLHRSRPLLYDGARRDLEWFRLLGCCVNQTTRMRDRYGAFTTGRAVHRRRRWLRRETHLMPPVWALGGTALQRGSMDFECLGHSLAHLTPLGGRTREGARRPLVRRDPRVSRGTRKFVG